MVLLSFVLQNMRFGAQLVVIGQVEADGQKPVSVTKIQKLLLVTKSGKSEPLPVALFPQIYPHLIEIEHNHQRVVYALDLKT